MLVFLSLHSDTFPQMSQWHNLPNHVQDHLCQPAGAAIPATPACTEAGFEPDQPDTLQRAKLTPHPAVIRRAQLYVAIPAANRHVLPGYPSLSYPRNFTGHRGFPVPAQCPQ